MILALALAAALAPPPSPRLGTDIAIDRPTGGTVAAVAGTVHISSLVQGDVVALGGDVELLPGARVEGDVLALGGSVTGHAPVSGRVVGIAPLGGRNVPFAATARQAAGLDLIRIGGWMALVTLLVGFAPRLPRRAVDELRTQPWRAGLIGIAGLAAWLAFVVLGLAAATSASGLILVGLSVALFLAAKVAGLAACALLLGSWLSPLLPPWLRGAGARSGIAAGILAVASLIPYAGSSLWALANVFGIGAVVAIALGPEPVILALGRITAR
jgi:hypothetical protein